MTVKELMEKFSKVDPDKNIEFFDPDGYEITFDEIVEKENSDTVEVNFY